MCVCGGVCCGRLVMNGMGLLRDWRLVMGMFVVVGGVFFGVCCGGGVYGLGWVGGGGMLGGNW